MQTGDDILFTAPGPDFGTIPTATTEIVGTPGNSLNVYWIVTHFPIGSVLSGPFPQKGSPNVLDDENYILISWLPAPGASSYDLLVTEDLQLPKQPGRFLLEANLTSTEFRDRGQSLDFYDIGGIPLGAPQEEHIYFDNQNRKQPTLRFIPWPIEVSSIIFEDGSSQNTAAGAIAAAPPNQAVQFNDNGAFGGSPNLTWDILNSRLGIGTQNPQQTLDVNGVISSTYGLFTPGPLNLNSGGNVIQFIAGPGIAASFQGDLNIFFIYQNTIHNGYLSVAGALMVETNGNIEFPNLPSTSAGPGSKRIWYDPGDGNVIKYAP